MCERVSRANRERRQMIDYRERISELKERRGAVIVAHNYVEGEVQEVADFVGDSLELSLKARELQASVLVFCGVRFMAETAKILSPASVVLHPVPGAGCPMAEMASGESVARYRREHPETVLVAYVNTTAAAKAEVDICCTSANAERIVGGIESGREVMFLPDRNLGANVSRSLGRRLELWPGFCPTHNRIVPETVREMRRQYPGVELLVHPECVPEVVSLADAALSTGGMLRYVRESSARRFLIGTEHGILHRMRKENPGKEFIGLSPVVTCPNMKKLTLDSIVSALETMEPRVELPEPLMERARRPIERMLAVR